ncbi:MAG TPA: metalloregulator ArsR/SmtB family transcription factor [Rhizomicrobium sp.]|nr:metalloregulator ArsR/SmtB family transcription factor [Rhizomicrobium sp.]
MPKQQEALNRVFHALSDPTRMAVVERLTRGPQPMSRLAEPFKMSLPSFAQHLEVLEKAGLVRSRKSGRVRTIHLSPLPLKAAESWLSIQREHWTKRLDQLDAYLSTLKEQTR